jgi:hypothetical protein
MMIAAPSQIEPVCCHDGAFEHFAQEPRRERCLIFDERLRDDDTHMKAREG